MPTGCAVPLSCPQTSTSSALLCDVLSVCAHTLSTRTSIAAPLIRRDPARRAAPSPTCSVCSSNLRVSACVCVCGAYGRVYVCLLRVRAHVLAHQVPRSERTHLPRGLTWAISAALSTHAPSPRVTRSGSVICSSRQPGQGSEWASRLLAPAWAPAVLRAVTAPPQFLSKVASPGMPPQPQVNGAQSFGGGRPRAPQHPSRLAAHHGIRSVGVEAHIAADAAAQGPVGWVGIGWGWKVAHGWLGGR